MPLTIAIPTYKRGAILVETLERLLALDPPAREIIVVDQTPEHPPEVAARLEALAGRITLIRLDRPSIPHAMNVALERASSAHVLFVDDDVDAPRGLAAAHERAYADPGVWAVVGQVLQPGEQPWHFGEATLRSGLLRDLGFRFNHDTACDVQNVIACNLSVDRARALSVGGFDENFTDVAYRFETEFSVRVVKGGGRVRFEPSAGLRHLKIPTGGVRAFGDHRRSAHPAHSMGDYYFARLHVPSFWLYVGQRLRQNVLTRYHLAHPWFIPSKLLGELRGLRLGLRCARGGQRLRKFAP
jgi:GT2 family glycosyltransferase